MFSQTLTNALLLYTGKCRLRHVSILVWTLTPVPSGCRREQKLLFQRLPHLFIITPGVVWFAPAPDIYIYVCVFVYIILSLGHLTDELIRPRKVSVV